MEKTCVLVVDDNKTNRDLYMDLLEMTPFSGVALDDGLHAVDMVRRHRPGLVLMDINLPRRSGMDVAADIIAALGDEAPPILAMTASALPDLIEQLQSHGFAGLVSKPCGVSTFLAAVTWGMTDKAQGFKLF
ncbi:MAG: response regulator [Magnetospirillum gryphiswaldense]|nr:response regulator [Magnetospirillum gryphiswaldense]